ncbi:MAG: phytoene/squalene synthase family protein [Cyanobacteria bacterium QS_8_64_29]|nr:MAG: phytoene/squalene synthase family protein [Cyanobacteria bacterium QS_8_64_29]
MSAQQDALSVLEATSRTFYIPIVRLPGELQAAVASGYLCMRAIDEIEDSPQLPNAAKAELLRGISTTLQASTERDAPGNFAPVWGDRRAQLAEVTCRIGEWAVLAPASIAPRVWDATAAMADRMAYWAERNWAVRTEADLDRYTFGVAGAVGLLLSDLWAWYDATLTDRTQAIGFGRGLQAVNILRNRSDDWARGVDFFPNGWTSSDMHAYAQRNLQLARAYTAALPQGAAREFCQIPLALAESTLAVLQQGREKLTRAEVEAIVEGATEATADPVAGSERG